MKSRFLLLILLAFAPGCLTAQQQNPDPDSKQEGLVVWARLKPMTQIEFQELMTKAQLGDAEAQYQVGLAYDVGMHVTKNSDEAERWFPKSAEQGYPPAEGAYGRRVRQSNSAIAERWMLKAAEHGDATTQFWLAVPYATVVAPQTQTSTALPADRTVSLKQLPGNILADQKDIWLFPVKLVHAERWWPTLCVLAVTAGLVASDAHTAPPFRTTNNLSSYNRVFSGTNTAAFIAAVPAAIYGVGLLHKDSYAEDSALFAAEAVADGFLLGIPLKAITARRQPLQYTGNGPYTDSFFNGSRNPFHSGGFFSNHAMAATAVATVLAHRYRQHRWVPFVAYGLAGAISFSRISTSNHFPGDAFFGGAMGFVIARYVVLPVH